MKDMLWHFPYSLRRNIYKMLRADEYKEYQQLRLEFSETDSLKPFIDRKAIFVHIPKTAGISVCHALFNSLSGGHKRIKEYTLAFSKQEFSSFYKFAFVRHPADRLCSAFHYLRNGGRTEEDKAYGQNVLAPFKDMNEFVELWFDHDKLHDYIHFIPQFEFMCISGNKPQVDYIGKFESLNEDFKIISSELNLDIELPELNSSKQKVKWQDQLTIKNRQKIADIYSNDYALFGYKV